MSIGQKLKALRNNRKLTVRNVEQASRRIAEFKKDERFRISNSWLTQLEEGLSEPGIRKLFTLSVIYRVPFWDLARLYDIDPNDVGKYEPIANPNVSQLLSEDTKTLVAPESLLSLIPGNESNTVLLQEAEIPRVIKDRSNPMTLKYGYIGRNDFTMYPLIRPEAIVGIDTNRTKLLSVPHNEYDRPIYFVELRDEYACGWCELHGKELLIIPHQSSPASIRRFTYEREAEILGRVISFYTRWFDESSVP